MQAQLERLEVEDVTLGVDDDDLPVDDGTLGKAVRTASTISGKYRVIGFSLRLPISTMSPSRKMTDRKPSHFGSYS